MSRLVPSRRSLIAGIAGLVASGLPRPAAARANGYYQGPVSDHFDGIRFFNPDGPNEGSRPCRGTEVATWRYLHRMA